MVDKQDVTPRLLPERARIEFHYPDENNTIVFVPFYENPDIKESQAANYADYNPIGRAGSLFAYTGSQSRKFKVKGTYTLPHLAEHPMGIERFLRTSFGNSTREQRALFIPDDRQLAKSGEPSQAMDAKTTYQTILQENKGIEPEQLEAVLGIPAESFFGPQPTHFAPQLADQLLLEQVGTKTAYDKVIDTLLFFVVLFRTSTVNNVENPVQGPPILRLTFGTLYQSIPCICKSYNLSWEEEAGYDLETLTPRRLVINLELEELRSGNFEKYDPALLIARNNLTGWESAIAAPFTTDPTNRAYN